VIRKRHAPKRPDGEMPDPQTRPEEAVEYAMALARAAGIR